MRLRLSGGIGASRTHVRRFQWMIAAFILCLTLGCTLSISLPAAPTAPPMLPPPDANGWQTLSPGLERRTYAPNPDNLLLQLNVLRVDPALYSFRAHYRPAAGLGLSGWLDALPGAAAFVNANFFDPQELVVGMVVSDGVASGQTLAGRGGMMQVANGQPRVRSLINEPYAGEALEQAVQAFPMLVLNGQASYNNQADRDVSRRTVVAQDTSGRILLMATSLLGLSLNDLSAFLAASDMALVNALNLDGGGSTMLYIGSDTTPIQIASFDAVPVVLAVYPR
jgi:hypothetical protein